MGPPRARNAIAPRVELTGLLISRTTPRVDRGDRRVRGANAKM